MSEGPREGEVEEEGRVPDGTGPEGARGWDLEWGGGDRRRTRRGPEGKGTELSSSILMGTLGL